MPAALSVDACFVRVIYSVVSCVSIR